MSKFKVKLSIEKFELEVEGNRDDIPKISNNLGYQFQGMLQPAANIVEDEVTPVKNPAAQITDVKEVKPRKRKPKPNKSTNNTSSDVDAIDWVNDPTKWGAPKQSWTTATKAMWLLYVVKNEKGLDNLTSNQIQNTFNKHFKQSGTIKSFNVTRDLGRVKSGKEAFVGEDTTKNPSTWFLTESGIKNSQNLVIEALSKEE